MTIEDGSSLSLFAAIPGDGNLSGSVEAADYTLWADGFGLPGAQFTTGDYNGDGVTNAADYTLWADNFGLSTSAPEGGARCGAGAVSVDACRNRSSWMDGRPVAPEPLTAR